MSENWIREMTSWSDKDKQVTFGKSAKETGYKCFLWHYRKDGTLPCFLGHGGQRLFIDLRTNTILLHTAVDNLIDYDSELISVIESSGKINS